MVRVRNFGISSRCPQETLGPCQCLSCQTDPMHSITYFVEYNRT